MRIKSLWISEYKNIKDLNLTFKSSLISLLVGKNGLGKSNLIEVLALIFRDLDLLDKIDNFENWAYTYFEYEICYECKGLEIKIVCKGDTFKVWSKPLHSEDLLQEVEFSKFKNTKKELFLPQYIIGYYSGENKRIRDIVRPYERIVWDELKKNAGLDKGFRRLFFAENHHAQMILLTLFTYRKQQDNIDLNDRINFLIDNFTSIGELADISIELKNPTWYKPSSKSQTSKSILQLEENLLNGNQFPFWNIKGKADKIISFFYNNSKSVPIYYEDDDNKTENIDLNNIDIGLLSSHVYENFGHAINFFDAFESLLQIDTIANILLKVNAKEQDVSFDFVQLSEGEQQLITVLGLLLITGQDDSLFLLDEPDTHLNPLWQREYVNLLDNFNLNNDNSHIIVATHSPLIVQAAEKADIFLYKTSESGKIEVSNEEFTVQNWRIDQVLTSEYFDLPSARPPQLDTYMALREEILSQGEITKEVDEKLKTLENEWGVLPTGETRDEIEALLLIKSITDKYKQ